MLLSLSVSLSFSLCLFLSLSFFLSLECPRTNVRLAIVCKKLDITTKNYLYSSSLSLSLPLLPSLSPLVSTNFRLSYLILYFTSFFPSLAFLLNKTCSLCRREERLYVEGMEDEDIKKETQNLAYPPAFKLGKGSRKKIYNI